MSFLYRYLLILIACGAVLLGIQVPNFIDQYQQRVDAHLREVQANLKGYQDIANRDFGGSLDALIRKHKESQDPAFRDEAVPMEDMVLRRVHFEAQLAALQASLPERIWYLLLDGDRALLRETWAIYTFVVPLNSLALLCGFGLAAALLFVVEILAGLFGALSGLRTPTRRTMRF